MNFLNSKQKNYRKEMGQFLQQINFKRVDYYKLEIINTDRLKINFEIS